MLYANVQQGMIRSVALDPTIPDDVVAPVVNLVRPVALAIDPRNKNAYYSDINTRQIGRYDPKTQQSTILHPGGLLQFSSYHHHHRRHYLC
jgi:sugar lactone lactonase YvrE